MQCAIASTGLMECGAGHSWCGAWLLCRIWEGVAQLMWCLVALHGTMEGREAELVDGIGVDRHGGGLSVLDLSAEHFLGGE